VKLIESSSVPSFYRFLSRTVVGTKVSELNEVGEPLAYRFFFCLLSKGKGTRENETKIRLVVRPPGFIRFVVANGKRKAQQLDDGKTEKPGQQMPQSQ
jgi:hypothetical protein